MLSISCKILYIKASLTTAFTELFSDKEEKISSFDKENLIKLQQMLLLNKLNQSSTVNMELAMI